MTTCYCCRKPRYKRLVDGLFPEDPQTPTPVAANMDKLLFFAQASPDHLDQIGEYLALRLRRSLQRERNGHVSVALKVTEKLLSACDARRLQLMVDSYLDILYNMLETNNTELHMMATNSFVKFAEREEGNTPYHRQYDFLIHRFASLSLTKDIADSDKYHETRLAGLRGLRGVIKKIGRQDSLQINIWDLDHMNKIVPPFLFNMHPQQDSQRSGESGEIQPVTEERSSLKEYSRESFIELITFAGLSHIDSVLKPILQHFDLNNLWLSDKEFTAGVYITVVETMQRQDRYKVVQSLVDHLDANIKESWETKQGILDTLSRCIAVAADSSLGPSVLDIFRTLVRHLRVSIETPSEGASALTSSQTFQQSITKTVGEFAGVLPDYHKPDILGLINSYVPVSDGGGAKDKGTSPSELAVHPLLSADSSSPLLTSTLVKCLRAVAETYHPSVLETAFPGQLFASLIQLFLIRNPETQLDVTLLWHRLVDHHGNKDHIPLNTEWVSLEAVGLTLGVVSMQFLSKTVNSLFTNLLALAKALSTESANTLAFYQLVFLLTLEFSHRGISDMLAFLYQLQEVALKEKELKTHHKIVLHATVAGMLYLAAKISRNETLKTHVDGVIAKRRETAPRLLPDSLFSTVTVDELDGGRGAVGVVSEEDILSAVADDETLLFSLKDIDTKRTSPPPVGGRQGGRDSLPELSSHFSVSLDYGPESPLNTDQISFNSLKERTELALSGRSGEGDATGGQGISANDIVFEVPSVVEVGSTPGVTFDAMVGQSARGDDSLGFSELTEILNTSVSPSVVVPGATNNLSSPLNAYDMELPSLH